MRESKDRPGSLTGTKEVCATASLNPSGTAKSRRSGRITAEVPILLIGSDAEGRIITEATHTVVLSQYGAGIVSKNKITAEQELLLRDVERNREAEVRVVGEIGKEGSEYTYGVAFLDARGDFWEREFPPPPMWDDRPPMLRLECGSCRVVVELLNGEFEYDVCRIHGGLARYCRKCGMLTVWRQPDDAMESRPVESGKGTCATSGKMPFAGVAMEERMEEPAQPAVSAQGLEIQPIAVPARAEEVERRERVRAKVNFFACVRSEEFGEDIVTCIDMSRGGVSIRSRNEYKNGMKLQIAVPFSPEDKEAPAIFVKGRIANVRAMGERGMWRCGVEFLR